MECDVVPAWLLGPEGGLEVEVEKTPLGLSRSRVNNSGSPCMGNKQGVLARSMMLQYYIRLFIDPNTHSHNRWQGGAGG